MELPKLVAVLALINAILHRVSTSLPQIHEATRGLLHEKNSHPGGVRANGLAKADA